MKTATISDSLWEQAKAEVNGLYLPAFLRQCDDYVGGHFYFGPASVYSPDKGSTWIATANRLSQLWAVDDEERLLMETIPHKDPKDALKALLLELYAFFETKNELVLNEVATWKDTLNTLFQESPNAPVRLTLVRGCPSCRYGTYRFNGGNTCITCDHTKSIVWYVHKRGAQAVPENCPLTDPKGN